MSEKPDVYLLTVESLRADKVGAQLTPNIDELASKSTVFSRLYCAGAPTAYSLKTILGGTYPFEYGYKVGLIDRVPTLPEMLRQAGYLTCTGYLMGWYSKIYGYYRGFDAWEEYKHSWPMTLKTLLRYAILHRVSIAELDRITDYLGEIVNQDRPVFYWCHVERTHQPYRPDFDQFREIHGGGVIRYLKELWDDEICWHRYRNRNQSIDKYISNYSTIHKSIQKLETMYDAQVASTDKYLGRFFSDLAEISSIRNRDYVIAVVSDHGEEFLDRGSVAHSDNSHDDSIAKVPLVIYESWNRKFESMNDLLSTLYVPRRVLSYAQIDAPEEWNTPYLEENGRRYIIQEGQALNGPFNLTSLSRNAKPEYYVKIRSGGFAFTEFLGSGLCICETGDAEEEIPYNDIVKVIKHHRRRQKHNMLGGRIRSLRQAGI